MRLGDGVRRQDVVPIVLGLLLMHVGQQSTFGQAAGRAAAADPYMGGMAPAPPGYTYAAAGIGRRAGNDALRNPPPQ